MKQFAPLTFSLMVLAGAAGAALAQNSETALPTTKTTSERVGNWSVECATTQQGKKTCAMVQTLSNAATKTVVLIWLIGSDGTGERVMTLRTPLGLLLSRGISVQVDDKPAFSMKFRTCISTFCEAVQTWNKPLLAMLRKGKSARVEVYNLQGGAEKIDVSLSGFAKGYEIFEREMAAK